jgi:hypothetical protein
MKKFFFIIVFTLTLISCGKKEEKFEAFSAEAFAYDLDNYWEVNVSVRVKGAAEFKDEKTDEYLYAFSFTIDLIHPDSTIEKNKFSFSHSQKSNEKLKDVGLEAQFELDSTYKEGNYKIVFNITDAHSNKSTSIEKELVLSK